MTPHVITDKKMEPKDIFFSLFASTIGRLNCNRPKKVK